MLLCRWTDGVDHRTIYWIDLLRLLKARTCSHSSEISLALDNMRFLFANRFNDKLPDSISKQLFEVVMCVGNYHDINFLLHWLGLHRIASLPSQGSI
jgi:hypothetical protein